DVNDNVCAIIKVRPTQAMNAPLIINTAGGMSAVPPPDGVANRQEDGSWWYWLPPQVKNIYFTAAGYTQTETLGVSLQSGKVYELQLVVDATVHQMQEFNLEKSVMKLTLSPETCTVSYGRNGNYDMGRELVKDGYFEAVLEKGTYDIKVEQTFYASYTGTYRVDENAKVKSISLQPEFGMLRLDSNPEGAEVYVDGFTQSLGQTPLVSRKIRAGKHTLKFWKENYYSKEIEVEVLPTGAEQDVPIVSLKTRAGTAVCTCADKDAELTVTDASGKIVGRGKSGMKVAVNSLSTYKLEASKNGHAPQSTGISGGTDIEGKEFSVTVGAPIPLYGGLQISSTPLRAEVLIDGESVGETTYMGKLLVGEHIIELRKEGYTLVPQTVRIEENVVKTLNLTMKEKQATSSGNSNTSYSQKDKYSTTTSTRTTTRKQVQPGTHILGFEGGIDVLSSKVSGDRSIYSSRFMYGLTYTYMPSLIGFSVGARACYPFADPQISAGVAVGLQKYFLLARLGYSSYNNGVVIDLGLNLTGWLQITYSVITSKKTEPEHWQLGVAICLPLPFNSSN
ncbi:MAG: PEGA domain-containing protein, partial [Bacteroidales bacterium]|nr:PEGA domain-containing protein [Bacteroidales bacterium]